MSSRRSFRWPFVATPLDVAFIVLVIFLLVSSVLDWRAVDVNGPRRAAPAASIDEFLLVEIRTDGLRLAGETVSLDVLGPRTGQYAARQPGGRVLVHLAHGVGLQEAVQVLDRLAVAGVTRVSLIHPDIGGP